MINFMALGGGQRVGASCYYLKLGNSNIILDAGTGMNNGVIFSPDLHSLKSSPFITSLSQINEIYISHAHMDHVGYLLPLIKEATQATTYMTETTKILTQYQLYDKVYINNKGGRELDRLATQSILDNVVNVTYAKTIRQRDYTATFFSAGHIPGAMMILFEYKKRKILYTGDYSVLGSPLTDGCFTFDNFNIDTVIMCGLHAKHPSYIKTNNRLYNTIEEIYKHTFFGKRVKCYVSQLTKGIELIKILNSFNKEQVPIYIDKTLSEVIEKIGKLSIPILTSNNYLVKNGLPKTPHIYITSKEYYNFSGYENIKVDFSLHEDFAHMKQFIKKLNAKQIYMVHCARPYNRYDLSIEQDIMYDECRTQFTFVEEKEIYRL
ncbi:MAG: MBL fold metallo-hydrolase [Epulopiscium sp. Nuni2H_MBin001]|nr:MAG: MBL fold metallo-hydrolase [Epulopiscium sp. Nuni2H_MBin001]